MAIIVDLPHVGESVVEGIIARWLKRPGDVLAKYEPLVEVVTDKVTMEVPSPVAGVLSRILVEEGATVPMGTPIAEVETTETDTQPAGTPTPAQVPSTPERSPARASTIGYLVTNVKPVGPTGGGVEEDVLVFSRPGEEAPAARGRYSPTVRRLAREHSVDLDSVRGTGSDGRITRNDVLGYLDARGPVAAAPGAVSGVEGRRSSEAVGPEEESLPLSPVRRMIAQRMVKSVTEIPHAWSMVEADLSELVRCRETLKEEFLRREGAELTYLPFVIKAVAGSLKGHPLLNSTWGGDRVILKRRVHIGIAVAAPEGLVVPVIHDADSLSVAGLAKAARELTRRAREGKLTLEDVQGGTFTVNNTGALGSVVSQPIINYPQAAILTSEAVRKRPVVVGDAIAIRSIMNLCLAFDHRITDGAEAGAFLQSVKGYLEAMGPSTPIY